MNKINTMQSLLIEASKLDSLGLYKQANDITKILIKLAQEDVKTDNNDDDLSIGEPEPQKIIVFSDREGNEKLRLADGTEVDIPKDLKYRDKFAEKEFLLSYDPEKEQFLYVSADRKTAFPLDQLNRVKEIRNNKVDVWKQFGFRSLFGDMRLPNLNKVIPLEPFVRRSVIDLANIFRPIGDEIKDDVRTNITDPATRVFQDLGGNVAGGKTPEYADAEKILGKSDDRTSTPSIVSETTVNVPGSETPLETPTDTPGEIPGGTDGTTDDAIDPVIKSNGKTLRDIKNPKDLLFWSMMVANRIPFSTWSQDKETEYYSKDRYDNTLSMINKLTSSNWVKRINPNIAGFKDGAISELGSRTANKTMNRQILASMNEICEELDKLDLVEASNEITKMMMKLAQENTFSYEEDNLVDTQQANAWTNFARSLAKKDPDFIPPIKPKASVITYVDVTEKALSEYHLYKSNKKQLPKLTSMEENQLKQLAVNADRAK